MSLSRPSGPSVCASAARKRASAWWNTPACAGTFSKTRRERERAAITNWRRQAPKADEQNRLVLRPVQFAQPTVRRNRRRARQTMRGLRDARRPCSHSRMKATRHFICSACDEAVTLPANVNPVPRCPHCGRNSLSSLEDARVSQKSGTRSFAAIRAAISLPDKNE